MPSTGFRSAARCSAQAVTKVYTVPANTTSSLSVSVLAPKNAFIFVQSADLDGVGLSSTQTFTPPAGYYSTVPASITGTGRNSGVQLSIHQRKYIASTNAISPDFDTTLPYVWQVKTGVSSTDTFDGTTEPDSTSSGLAYPNGGPTLIGASHQPGSTTNNFSFNKNQNYSNGNTSVYAVGSSAQIYNPMAHPILDVRANPEYCQVHGFFMNALSSIKVAHVNSVNTNISQPSGRRDYGQSGLYQYQFLNPSRSNSSSYSAGYIGYSGNITSYANRGLVVYGDPSVGSTGFGTNSNGYLTYFTNRIFNTTGDGWNAAGSVTTNADNWIYHIARDQSLSTTTSGTSGVDTTGVVPSWKYPLDVMFDGTEASNTTWYTCTTIDTNNNNRTMITRKPTTDNWNQDSQLTPTGNIEVSRLIEPGSTNWVPYWVMQLGGAYFCCFVGNGGGLKNDWQDFKLFKNTGTFSNGTWSEVDMTSYKYVDLGVKPMVISDNIALMGKWSDQTNFTMTNNYVDTVEQSQVAAMTVTSGAESWTENYLDYSQVTDYTPINAAVTQALTDASLTPTGQRTITDGSTLYDTVIHTSDSNFVNILSTVGDRSTASDITDALSTSFERTNLVLNAGESVYVFSESDDTIVQVYGYEDS